MGEIAQLVMGRAAAPAPDPTPGVNAAARANAQAAAAEQRRSLAELARQQGEVNQAAATGARRRGRGLLTFLSGQGQATLG